MNSSKSRLTSIGEEGSSAAIASLNEVSPNELEVSLPQELCISPSLLLRAGGGPQAAVAFLLQRQRAVLSVKAEGIRGGVALKSEVRVANRQTKGGLLSARLCGLQTFVSWHC